MDCGEGGKRDDLHLTTTTKKGIDDETGHVLVPQLAVEERKNGASRQGASKCNPKVRM